MGGGGCREGRRVRCYRGRVSRRRREAPPPGVPIWRPPAHPGRPPASPVRATPEARPPTRGAVDNYLRRLGINLCETCGQPTSEEVRPVEKPVNNSISTRGVCGLFHFWFLTRVGGGVFLCFPNLWLDCVVLILGGTGSMVVVPILGTRVVLILGTTISNRK
jgi:hypothetical protein